MHELANGQEAILTKRLTRFQKRELERQQQVMRWNEARASFRHAVENEGADLQAPFHVLRATSSWDEAQWYAFWDRKEIKQRDADVMRRIERGAFAPESLQGGPSAYPGEARTGSMWCEAFSAGPRTFDAALMLTAIRSSYWWGEPRTPSPSQSLMDELAEGAYRVLEAANVQSSTTSTVWFLPRRFAIEGEFADMTALAATLGKALGNFLERWTPVRIAVEHVVASGLRLEDI